MEIKTTDYEPNPMTVAPSACPPLTAGGGVQFGHPGRCLEPRMAAGTFGAVGRSAPWGFEGAGLRTWPVIQDRPATGQLGREVPSVSGLRRLAPQQKWAGVGE